MVLLKKILVFPCAFLFGILLVALTVVDILSPDKVVSELENRVLRQPPQFNAGMLAENRWTGEYGEYVREQFVFRDGWLKTHSFIENGLQKIEINGVWLGRDDYLMAKTPYSEASIQSVLQTNVKAVCAFAEKHPGKVYVMLVPSASNVLSGRLRANPPRMDENAAINAIYMQLETAGVYTIDLREIFSDADASGSQVYYRTDHHWTTDGGAFLAYEAFINAAGRVVIKPPVDLISYTDGFYGSNYSKALNVGAVPDQLIYYDLANTISIERQSPDGSVYFQEETLMAYAKLETRDKYGAFLHGINGYTHIDGNGHGSIAVIKDSYGNCFAPYLVANYENIEAIDLRGRQSIDDLVSDDSDVLVLYSFTMFSQDVDLFWLS